MVQWCILQLFYQMQPLIELSWYNLDTAGLFWNYRKHAQVMLQLYKCIWVKFLHPLFYVDFNVDSSIFAHVTQDLVPKNVLHDDFIQAIKYSDYSSVSAVYNLIKYLLCHFICYILGECIYVTGFLWVCILVKKNAQHVWQLHYKITWNLVQM